MVKGVSEKNNIDNQYQIKPPKKENGLTKFFHSIKKSWDSLFAKPLADRKIELKDEIEEVFGEVEAEVAFKPKLEFTEAVGLKQPIQDIELEIEVLRDRSADLQEEIIAEEKSDPWGLRGMVERVLGKDKLSTLKEDKQIIDDLIEAKMANRIKRINAEKVDLPEGLELDEISDEEIDLK